MVFQLLFIFLIPLVLSLAITPWVLRLAVKFGAIDEPNARKVHNHPVPRLGGVAIYASFFLSVELLLLFSPSYYSFSPIELQRGVMLMSSLILVLALGIFDDLRPLSARQKFVVQLLAGSLVYLAGFRISSITYPFGPGLLDLGVLDYPATLLWVVGIMNAFNLIDGLDGLASGVAAIASLTIFSISFLLGDTLTAVIGLLLAGTVIGFLRYNFNPARIFLGDSGSLFLGFSLAVLSIQGSTKGTTAIAILVPVLALGLPIMDTLLSMSRRLLRSLLPQTSKSGSLLDRFDSIFLADRGHIHHQLIARGLSHRNVVLLLYLVSCAFGIGAFAVTISNNVGASLIITSVAIATIIGVRQLRYKEMAVLRNGVLLPIYEWPFLNRTFFLGFLDMAFIVIAYGAALLLVYRGTLPIELREKLPTTLPLVCGINLVIFYFSGLYKGTFRQLGLGEVLKIVKAVALSVISIGILFAFLPEWWNIFNISVFVLSFYFLLSMVAGSRISFHVLNYLFLRDGNAGKRVLIYGADASGMLTLQQILNSETLGLNPVGFLDDSPQLEGKRLNGYPIFGGHWKLQRLLKKARIDQVLIASERIKPEILKRLKETAARYGIPIKRSKMLMEDVPIEAKKR